MVWGLKILCNECNGCNRPTNRCHRGEDSEGPPGQSTRLLWCGHEGVVSLPRQSSE